MNLFGNRRSSHQDSTPSISFSMGMPSLPTSSQQQAEYKSSPSQPPSSTPSSSSTTSSSTLTRGTSSTPRDRQSNGNLSQEIELVTPQSSSSVVVKANILPEFSIDYESDDEDSFEDVEFGGTNIPTTINGGCTAEQEMNQRGVTRKFHAPRWIPTNIVQLGLCLGIVTFMAVAVVVVVVMMSLTTVSSPTATTTTATANTNSAIDAATGSTLYHNVTLDSVWMPPSGNSTRRGLRHLSLVYP